MVDEWQSATNVVRACRRSPILGRVYLNRHRLPRLTRSVLLNDLVILDIIQILEYR